MGDRSGAGVFWTGFAEFTRGSHLFVRVLAVDLILKVAEILDVSANELLGLDTKAAPKKRGPQSQLEKQMAAIASLPRKEQQQLLAVVEALISPARYTVKL
jgi:hypothetical protein